MKKRFLRLLCVLAFALPFVVATPCFAATSETTIDQITYRYDTETGEATVNDADESISGNAVIPGTIEVDGQKYKVTSIGDWAFSRCFSLTGVVIPEGVTSIGGGAFDSCFHLTEVTIPEGVTSIGDGAFFTCYELTRIVIPEGVTSIGDRTFYYCGSLTEVTIPEGVTSIGDGAFVSCTGLTKITLPEGVTSIGDRAFYDCSSLTEVVIPGSVTSIGDGAFEWCDKLTNVYVEEGVSLGANSFSYASQDVHVWRYEVLESAEASDDGKTHVAIVSVKDKDNADIADSLTITDGAMGDGYVIDEVKLENLTLAHTLTKTEASPATCTEPGNVDGWTCDTCGKHFKDENGTEEIEESQWIISATGHSYSAPTWTWSEDGKSCTVTFTCENDAAHKETPEVTVASEVKMPATCTETGVTTYTATVEFGGRTYTDTKDVADIPATGHELTKTEGKAATCTEPGSVEHWTCSTCGKYFSDENGSSEITAEDTMLKAIGHSYENGKCTVCGGIDPSFKAMIIEGANGKWQKGSEGGLPFTSNAVFADFQKVQVDGRDVDASNYTVAEGSTIVTLKPSYLETLSAGKHTLAIVSDTGTAETEFTVLAAEGEAVDSKADNDGDKESLAKTGDSSMLSIAVLSILAIASIVAGVLALRRSRI